MTSHRGIFAVLALCVCVDLPLVRSETASTTEKHELPQPSDAQIVRISHALDTLPSGKQLRLNFTSFSYHLHMTLTPTEGILIGRNAPVWRATTVDGRVEYEKLNVDILQKAVLFFQNKKEKAAILIRGDQSPDYEFFGLIGNLGIRPVRPTPKPTNRHQRSVTEDGMIISGEHWVTVLDEKSRSKFDGPIMEVANSLASEQRSKREAKTDINPEVVKTLDVVYPTILATADFPLKTKSHYSAKFYDAVLYQLAFWNAVDLRYRSLENPKIRLRIAGLIFQTDVNAAPYMNYPVYSNNTKDVNGEKAASAMQQYWFDMRDTVDFSINSYHIVATITFRWFSDWNQFRGWSEYSGVTRMAPICNTTTGYTMRPVMMAYDDQAFDGVTVATHEIGHALGVIHDRNRHANCQDYHGYIMDPFDKSEPRSNNLRWSKCSKDQLSKLLSSATCMQNPLGLVPVDSGLAKVLPGSIRNADQQCVARGWHYSCAPTATTCTDLQCYVTSGWSVLTNFGMCKATGPALDGTLCGKSQICVNRKCRRYGHL